MLPAEADNTHPDRNRKQQSAAATIVAAAAVAAEKCSKATSTAWYPPAHPLVLW